MNLQILLNFLYSFIDFVKLFLLFMSLLVIVRQGFLLFKSVAKSKDFEITKKGVWLLGIAFAYVLTLIFV